jgi:hypothetical protein
MREVGFAVGWLVGCVAGGRVKENIRFIKEDGG